MEQLSQLWAQLESIEFWINTHFNNQVCITLQNIEEAIKSRHLLIQRIKRLQLRGSTAMAKALMREKPMTLGVIQGGNKTNLNLS